MHQSKNSVILKKSKKGINSYQMPLYPPIEQKPADAMRQSDDQRFRLDRIAALDGYLGGEIETRRKLAKKYQRALNAVQGVAAGTGAVGLGLEVAGLSLLATGVGSLPGIVLSGIGAGAFGVDLLCGMVNRKLSRKIFKHHTIEQTARTKLNTIHKHVSLALSDGLVSDPEYRLIVDEVEAYDLLKEAIRSKSNAPNDDTAIKKQWLQTEFQKYMQQFQPKV
jgi:hypothetical protein